MLGSGAFAQTGLLRNPLDPRVALTGFIVVVVCKSQEHHLGSGWQFLFPGPRHSPDAHTVARFSWYFTLA